MIRQRALQMLIDGRDFMTYLRPFTVNGKASCKPITGERTALHHRMALIGAIPVADRRQGLPEDLQVEREGPVLDITHVEPDCFVPRQI